MLEIKNVSVKFSDESDVQAVEDVTLTVYDGQKIALVGETGSGKSVLLLAILRLLPETAIVKGQVLYQGEDLLTLKKKQLNKIRGAEISYVPQGGGGSMNPLMKVGFQVGEPLMEHKGFTKKQAMKKSVELLKMFRLGDEEQLANAYPHTFSGGMRQRAMVAMGISAGANLVLADEPSKGLDEKRVSLVVDAFNQLKDEGLLCVTHDMMFAGKISDHICVLYAAQQVEYGPTEEMLKNPLHPYTQDMISAIPENGMNVSMTGFAPPHTGYENYGCRYKHRCKYCVSKCDTMPPVFTVGNRKVRCWKYENEN